MQIKIEERLCKACGYCIHFCPKSALGLSEDMNELGYQYVKLVKMEECVGCGICATICPDAVIELENEGGEG